MPAVWFNRWAKSSAFTTSELRILEALLVQSSLIGRKLLKQAQQAPYVLRVTKGNEGYEATIPYVEDHTLLVDIDRNVQSPIVETSDPESGRRLRFSTTIIRGGFLSGLKGTVIDGRPWPRKWNIGSEIVRPQQVPTWLDALESPVDGLTASEVLRKLVDWSGADSSRLVNQWQNRLRLSLPASDYEIAECERRLSITLPSQYREFVRITNGFGINNGRPYEVLGTNDVVFIDQSRKWVCITPLYEDGVVAMRCKDDVPKCFLLASGGRLQEVGDLRQHIRDSLIWDIGTEGR
jgi:hypothetical protein